MKGSGIPISVVVVTKNAADSIEACLSALYDFEQVVVVDSCSHDGTAALAARSGAEVVHFRWNGNYPKKRQWCLETLALRHDWVFFVDADEVVSADLRACLEALFREERPEAGFFIPGFSIWNDKTLSPCLLNRKIALLHRRRMEFPVVDDLDCPGMGEIESHYQPVRKTGCETLPLKFLDSAVFHYANKNPEDWRAKHERYAAWEACMNRKRAWPEDPVRWREIAKRALRANPLRPEIIFFVRYVIDMGFLDGRHGLDFAAKRWWYYHNIRKKSFRWLDKAPHL